LAIINKKDVAYVEQTNLTTYYVATEYRWGHDVATYVLHFL